MFKYERIYDISLKLGKETTDPLGGIAFEKDQNEIILDGEIFRGTFINMFAHAGTHVDAPCHLSPHGKTLEEYSLNRFIVPATVVEIKDSEAIRPENLLGLKILTGQALLFKTDNSISGRVVGKTSEGPYVYMTLDALTACLEKGVSLLGFDFGVAEKPGGNGAPLHHRCFEADAIILEGLNLKDIPVGNYTLIALPLRMEGTDGSPVRAVLLS